MSKKKFFKNEDPTHCKYFNKKVWDMMTEGEKEMWQPSDNTPWDQEEKLSKDERFRRANQNSNRIRAENLKIKEGSEFNLGVFRCELLTWGPRFYLISLDASKHHPDSKKKFGIMQRTTLETSYGTQDTLSDRQHYQSYDSLEQAQEAYHSANR